MNNNKIKFLNFILVVMFFSGCATSTNEFPVPEPNFPENFRQSKIGLVKPLFISDLLGPKSKRENFDSNLFTGLIEFKGGLIHSVGVTGLPEVQSKEVILESEEQFREDVSSWIEQSLTNILSEIGYSMSNENTEIKLNIQRMRRKVTSQNSGDDNINLPLYHYRSNQKLSKLSLSNIRKETDARYLIIPVVVYYYAHTPGWFNGQEWGCQGGIRIGVNLIFYDMASGKKVDELMIERKKIFKIGRVLNYTTYMGELDELKAEIEKQWINIFLP